MKDMDMLSSLVESTDMSFIIVFLIKTINKYHSFLCVSNMAILIALVPFSSSQFFLVLLLVLRNGHSGV